MRFRFVAGRLAGAEVRERRDHRVRDVVEPIDPRVEATGRREPFCQHLVDGERAAGAIRPRALERAGDVEPVCGVAEQLPQQVLVAGRAAGVVRQDAVQPGELAPQRGRRGEQEDELVEGIEAVLGADHVER